MPAWAPSSTAVDSPLDLAHKAPVSVALALTVAACALADPVPRLPDKLAADAPGFSISFAFEPRLGSYREVDRTLTDYGFAKVDSPLFLTYGLRARAWTQSGWIFGGAMSYGFRSTREDGNPVPTTMTAMEMKFTAGHQLGAGFDFMLDAGFGSHVMGVGSTAQGGALVYLGPSLAPRVGYRLPTGASFLRLSLGYTSLFPIGRPHQQALWGDDFRQLPVHAFIFGLESGFASRLPRWRWRTR